MLIVSQIDKEIEDIRRESNRVYSHVTRLHFQMREIGFVAQVAVRSLDFFKNVLQQDSSERNYSLIKSQWEEECQELLNEDIKSFEYEVSTRDYYFNIDHIEKLDSKIRKELKDRYSQKINSLLQQYMSTFVVSQNTDFTRLVQNLEREKIIGFRLFEENLSQKTFFINQKHALDAKEKELQEMKDLVEK